MFQKMFRIIRLFLVALVCLAIGNYLETIVLFYGYNVTPARTTVRAAILFTTTLLAGLVINLGTIIQIVTQLRRNVANVDFKYTECLLFGSFVLFVSQMHGTTIELMLLDNHDQLTRMSIIGFIATPITTLLSFICVLIFFLVTKRQETRALYHLPRKNDRGTIRSGRDVVFVEGTACIGKTTSCDVSFDFARYRDECALYRTKHELPYVQVLYEANLYSDIINEILNKDSLIYAPSISAPNEKTYEFSHRRENYYFFDRSNVSQLAYAILFHLDGARCEPKQFAIRFNRTIEQNLALVEEIRRVYRKWAYIYEKLNPNGLVSFLWFGASTPEKVAARIRDRNGHECNMNDWNLTYYTYNQNYTFCQIQKICNLGKYVETDLITYEDLVKYVKNS